jgi:hypothetical protein
MAEQGFLTQIRDAFVADQSNQFLVTGNVLDVFESEDADGETTYEPLTAYLSRKLSRKRRLVIRYNIARGIEFESEEDEKIARQAFLGLFSGAETMVGSQAFDEVLSRSTAMILPSLVLLQKLCRACCEQGQPPLAILIEHADALLPEAQGSSMNDVQRQRLVFFREWLTDVGFISSPHLLIMQSETASAVHSAVTGLPHLLQVPISLPSETQRRRYIRNWPAVNGRDLKLRGSQKAFAGYSAGMTLLAIDQTMRLARHRKGKLERGDFLACLNRLLTSRIGDHVEVQHPEHSFKDVIGATALKAALARVEAALSSNDPKIAPVGMLVTGPNGVGKTYVLTAWARECKRVVIVLKNLRGSYFGETDQIFEKVRQVLEVLGNVMIIVDEADTVFAKPGENTHQTEQRLFGNVIQMMGDPRNRSRIVWVLMTARPDNLAPDVKRAGRCGLHLPIFDPEGADREAFINFVLGKCDLQLSDFKEGERLTFLEKTCDLSPADFNELAIELRTEVAISKQDLTPSTVMRILEDYLPGTSRRERRLQSLHAWRHCSRRSLLPPSFAALTRDDVDREIEVLENV